jgi:SWI/SNF-related matrix-associated actin-dependent regulator of chromatin subfamily A-like protein 1
LHPDLYPYQRTGAEWLAVRSAGLLADEMGVGKTPQAIAACDAAGVRSVLVLTPGIARVNWKREFERWQTIPRTVFVVRSGDDLRSVGAFCADVLVCSYAILAQKKARAYLAKLDFDALIADEAHALKEPTAVRSRAVYGHKFDRAVGLASRSRHVWLAARGDRQGQRRRRNLRRDRRRVLAHGDAAPVDGRGQGASRG